MTTAEVTTAPVGKLEVRLRYLSRRLREVELSDEVIDALSTEYNRVYEELQARTAVAEELQAEYDSQWPSPYDVMSVER